MTSSRSAGSSAWAHLGETNVDELTTVSLVYGDNLVSQFTCTFLVESANDFWIYGTKGRIRIHPPFWGATRATLMTGDREATVTLPFRGTGFEYEIEEAMRSIREGETENPVMSPADSLANMELMDGIRATVGLKYAFEVGD